MSQITQGIPQVNPSEFLGRAMTITIASSPGCTHSLTWKFGDRTGTIGENIATETQWTPPLDLADQIPNSPSGICTITCATYQNGTPVGTPQSAKVTLNVPQSLGPTVTADYYDTSPAHDVFPFLVEKISRLWVVPDATAQYGASITGTAVLLDGKPYTGTTMSSGYHVLAILATDSRGITGNVTYTVFVEPYGVPQLELSASRCLEDGTADDTGSFARITMTGSVASLEGNRRELTLTYGTMTVAVPLTENTFSVSTVVPANPEKTLSIQASLRDSLRTAQRSMTLSTAYATMDFLSGGKGIAFGAVAAKPGFHCAMDAQFSGKLTDAAGRELVSLKPLTPVEGLDMTMPYGRVLRVLDAQTLQLRLTVTAEIPKGTTLFSETGLFRGITGTQNLPDAGNTVFLKASANLLQTASPFPPGTYTFHTAIY